MDLHERDSKSSAPLGDDVSVSWKSGHKIPYTCHDQIKAISGLIAHYLVPFQTRYVVFLEYIPSINVVQLEDGIFKY